MKGAILAACAILAVACFDRANSQYSYRSSLESPCPQIFEYEQAVERNKWYGSVKIKPEVTLYGFWIDIILDREAESVGNWIGDVSTIDNIEYKIENKRQILNAYTTTAVRFFVKYREGPAPKIKHLRLNGQQICSAANEATTASNHRPGNQHSTSSTDRNRGSTVHVEALSVNGEEYVIDNNNDWETSNNSTESNCNGQYNCNKRDRGSSTPNYNSRNCNDNSNCDNNGSNQNNRRTTTSYTNNYGNNDNDQKSTPGSSVSNSYRPNKSVYDTNDQTSYGDTNKKTNQRDASTQYVETTTKILYPSRDWQTGSTNSNNDQNSGGRIRPVINTSSSRRPQQFNNDDYKPTESSRPQATTTKKQSYNSNDYDYDSDHSTNKNKGTTSNDYFEGDFKFSSSSKIRPTPLPSRGTEQPENECGKVAAQPRPLIVGGQTTTEGQWPWHVALYHSQTIDSSKYICGGSLISTSHVLTAAHCVTHRGLSRKVDPSTLTVYLGKYNLRKSGDSVQIMLVKKIFIHPQYNASNFYADLAILKFNKPCEYTIHVRPVCLWKDENKDLSNIIDKEGTVVGWGFDQEGKVTEELTLVKMPVVKQSTCLWSFKEFYTHFTSEQSFCAGFENGTSVCNGDSGGGMVFPETNRRHKTPTWRIRGLVSIGVAKQYEYKCDPYHYVVFTDVAQFLTWIEEKLQL